MEKDKQLISVPIFSEKPVNEKNENFMRFALMIFALFATASLLITGCSASTPVTQPNPSDLSNPNAANAGGVTPLNESKNVSIDATNKSEIQKTQDTITNFVIADGTYADPVTYMSPGGQNSIKISVTTKGDVVTDASVTVINCDMTSQRYVGQFNTALPSLVVGKKISDITIPHTVSGSSLTSAAFAKHLKDLVVQHPG